MTFKMNENEQANQMCIFEMVLVVEGGKKPVILHSSQKFHY